MDNYYLEKDIIVFYVTADSFPDGIDKAHQQLHNLLPSVKDRNFFGLSRPEKGAIVYKAAVEELSEGEGKKYGCDSLIIKKGHYISITVSDYTKHIEQIAQSFQVLLADPRIDHKDGYCVEVYLNETDVKCMVRLNDHF